MKQRVKNHIILADLAVCFKINTYFCTRLMTFSYINK